MTFSAYIKAKLIAYVDVARKEKLSLLLSQKINCMNYEEKKKRKVEISNFLLPFFFLSFINGLDLKYNARQPESNYVESFLLKKKKETGEEKIKI